MALLNATDRSPVAAGSPACRPGFRGEGHPAPASETPSRKSRPRFRGRPFGAGQAGPRCRSDPVRHDRHRRRGRGRRAHLASLRAGGLPHKTARSHCPRDPCLTLDQYPKHLTRRLPIPAAKPRRQPSATATSSSVSAGDSSSSRDNHRLAARSNGQAPPPRAASGSPGRRSARGGQVPAPPAPLVPRFARRARGGSERMDDPRRSCIRIEHLFA
jgi:hypothetical protein